MGRGDRKLTISTTGVILALIVQIVSDLSHLVKRRVGSDAKLIESVPGLTQLLTIICQFFGPVGKTRHVLRFNSG